MAKNNESFSDNIFKLLQDSEESKLRGENKEAIEFAEKALAKDPSCVEALEEIADNYLAMNNTKKAAAAAEFALELSRETSYTALYILGFIASRENKFAESIEFLEKANDIKPSNAEILRALGWACFMDNKRVKGIVILERALNLSSDDIMILCDLGICYIKEDQTDKALELFYRAMEINPDDERIKECIRIAEEVNDTTKKKLN